MSNETECIKYRLDFLFVWAVDISQNADSMKTLIRWRHCYFLMFFAYRYDAIEANVVNALRRKYDERYYPQKLCPFFCHEKELNLKNGTLKVILTTMPHASSFFQVVPSHFFCNWFIHWPRIDRIALLHIQNLNAPLNIAPHLQINESFGNWWEKAKEWETQEHRDTEKVEILTRIHCLSLFKSVKAAR